MPTHRIRSIPLPAPAGSVAVARGADAVSAFLEDAAHHPGGWAAGVAHPASEAEVGALLRRARRVLPVGAQSSLTGGATPMGELVVTTRRLDGIVAASRDSMTVQAGVPIAELQAALARRDAWYPPVPTFEGACMGGAAATNAAGAATFKYGATRDWVRGLKVVLADGSLLELQRGEHCAHPDGYFELQGPGGVRRIPLPGYRMPDVPKRSAGYFARAGMDAVDLFIGSEGTLGVVTEVTCGVVSPRPETALVWLTAPDEGAALALVAVLRGEAQATWRSRDPRGLDVAAVEHLDRRSLELLREEGAGLRHDVAAPADAVVALLIQVELPRGAASAAAGAYDQIGRALTPGAPDTPLVRLCRMLEREGVLDRAEIALPADGRRQAQFRALREAVPEAVNRRVKAAQREVDAGIRKTAADMIVPFERFADSLDAFRNAFEQRGLDHAIWGHVSDANVHPNVIPRSLRDVERGQQAIMACGREVIRMGGCPLAEHGVGRNRVKQALLRDLYGAEGIAAMRAVKAALDPAGKLAPGVLFPAAAPGGEGASP